MLFESIADPRLNRLLANSTNLQDIIGNIWEHLMVFDRNSKLVHHSGSPNPNLALGEEDVETFISLIDEEYQTVFQGNLNRAWGAKEPFGLDYVLRTDPAHPVWVNSSFCFVEGDEDQESFICVFSKEISNLKKYEAHLKSLAYNDPLTNLPNRRSLLRHYQQMAAFSKRYSLQIGIIYIDVDDFKTINDTFGHAGGDEFLKQVSALVGLCLRESDILARVGGDEFVVLLNNLPSLSVIDTVINRIYGKMAAGLELEGSLVVPSLSIGVAVYPEHGETLDELLQRADSALYQAKRQSKNTYSIYS